MTARSKVVFTVQEANRTLPLVRSIVGDVAHRWEDLIKVREEYGNSSPEHDRIMRELGDYIQELKVIGCHLKDFEKGIVNFPALVDGREVCLTWQLGDDEVTAGSEPPGEEGEQVSIPGLEAEESA